MRKNNMKTLLEKEMIVKRYLSGESATKLSDEFEINRGMIYLWITKYEEKGVEGLESQTGKTRKAHKHMGLHFRNLKVELKN